ncbi:MAG: prealbumin-like fold domain-containing protein [Oscillospiraceae bacterium]|nr:prealbumin-like fold domain-containing protein [Oscillospiraceae bacterium]
MELGSFGSAPTINAVSNVAGVDNLNDNYISQVFTVSSVFSHSSYSVQLTGNVPEGAIITDLQNNYRSAFYAGEQFKVLIPKENIGSNIWNPDGVTWSSQYIGFDINVTAYLQNNPILWGAAPRADWQDYALITFRHTRTNGNTRFNYRTEGGAVQIIKESENHNYWTDEEEGSRVAGAVFEISRADTNEVIRIETTDVNGNINIIGLPVRNI